MKIIVMFVCMFALSDFITAQDVDQQKFKMEAGVSLGIPASNLPANKIGAGVDLLAQYVINNKLALTADAGYMALFAKYDLPVTGVVPFRIGVRYFPAHKLYVAAKGGLALYTLATTSISYAAYALGAGYYLNNKFDVSASYDGFVNSKSSFGYMGLRLGYQF